MNRVNAEKYETTMSQPFSNGTEVWFMVGATGYDSSFAVSEDYILQIGQIERSNISSITISNIHQFPQTPTKEDTVVTVSADITSNITLTDTWFGYKHFTENGSGGGSGIMGHKSGYTFEEEIYISDEDEGTMIFYKIAAKDASGNTATSPTFNFTIS
jgi:hypothetical protein